MRSASSKNTACWALVWMLAASTLNAAPTILSWSMSADHEREAISVRWDEAGQYQLNKFSDARQYVIVLPEAKLRSGVSRSTDLASAVLLKRARLQEVTLPDGKSAVQITVNLREWTEANPVATAEGITLEFSVPKDLRREEAKAQEPVGYDFTDERLAAFERGEFGSRQAPATGAGQAANAATAAVSEYYVPPAATGRGAAAAGSAGDALGNEIESKLGELVRRVDFQGTSLENVLRLISEEAELNLLIKPSDLGNKTVTLRLRNVTLRQMLEAILKANDLGYTVEDGSIIRIVPREQVKSTLKETVVETVPINWVSAADVKAALEPFVDPNDGTVQVAGGSNLLIIRDVPETVQALQDLIAKIDVPEKQVLIEMRLVNLSESARRAIGSRTSYSSTDTQTRPLTGDNGAIGTRNSTTTNTGVSTNTSNFTNDISSGIEGSTVSSRNATSNATNSTSLPGEVFPTAAGSAGLLAPTASAFRFNQLTTLGIFGNDYDVNFQLNAQEERGDAVTLANPTVLALNNVKAVVEIQREIPYVSAQNSDTGSVGTVEFKPVGTQVDVLPRITNNGYVRMELEPSQVIDTGERIQGVPLTDKRSVEASVIVKDEQTIALGGLRSFEATAAENGVPYLLRVPVISWLFKNQANSQSKIELYLFVTPHILKDPTPTAYQKSLYDKIDYNWDLPDYFFDEVFARKSPGEDESRAKETKK